MALSTLVTELFPVTTAAFQTWTLPRTLGKDVLHTCKHKYDKDPNLKSHSHYNLTDSLSLIHLSHPFTQVVSMKLQEGLICYE